MEKEEKLLLLEQFLLFTTIFCYLLLDFRVKSGTRFSHRDQQLVEIREVKITIVDCKRLLFSNFETRGVPLERQRSKYRGTVYVSRSEGSKMSSHLKRLLVNEYI